MMSGSDDVIDTQNKSHWKIYCTVPLTNPCRLLMVIQFDTQDFAQLSKCVPGSLLFK